MNYLAPNLLMTDIIKKPNQGLYESYYFRGNSICGQYGFWLKHNILRFHHDRFVIFEATFITFDLKKKEARSVKVTDKLSDFEFKKHDLFKTQNWDIYSHHLSENSWQSISIEKLEGKLIDESGVTNDSVQWSLARENSNQPYYHFDSNKLYHSPFPKKKILTRETKIKFKGAIKTSWGFNVDTEWIGMNGHNWGTEHAFHYAYADSNQFNGVDAYFDGFSAKLALAGGLIKSPYLSLCSLRIESEWYHFNQLQTSFLHKAQKVEDTLWQIIFENRKHQLEVLINGDPTLYPWIALDYDHPNHKVSVILNTKFAHGTFKVYERNNRQAIHEITSDFVELETGKIKN